MIYLKLFCEFFKIGLFSFGGGYSTLPFLYHISARYHWFSESQLSNMLAVSSITPGPVGVNVATFAGFTSAGILGALIATLALILPSYILVVTVSKLLSKFKENKYVQTIIYVIKPTGCALLSYVAWELFRSNVSTVVLFLIFSILLFFGLNSKRDALACLGLSAILGLILGALHLI